MNFHFSFSEVINDPVFGVTTASVYTQVVLQGTPSFGITPVADSIILSLSYSGYFGDTNTVQTFNVFELTQEMYTDSQYYSTKNFNYNPSPLGTISFAPQPNTNVDSTLSPRIRITLNKALADSIVALDPSKYSSNSDWVSYFKGIFIQAQNVNSPGAISYFNFFESKLTLYFHNDTVNKSYDFSLTGARVNNFAHNFGTSHAGLQLTDSLSGDSLNYLQSMAGIKIRVSLPYLKHFLDSGSILVNSAELKINAEPVNVPYKLPGRLLLVSINENGESILPIDYFESSGYYGGALNATSDGYTFNICPAPSTISEWNRYKFRLLSHYFRKWHLSNPGSNKKRKQYQLKE